MPSAPAAAPTEGDSMTVTDCHSSSSAKRRQRCCYCCCCTTVLSLSPSPSILTLGTTHRNQRNQKTQLLQKSCPKRPQGSPVYLSIYLYLSISI
jgi:hypothetical protein